MRIAVSKNSLNFIFNKILPAFLFIILSVGLLYYYGFRPSYQLDNFGRYTIAITVDYYHTANFVQSIHYKYNVKGKEYIGGATHRNSIVPNGRYFAKYSQNDNSISEIYQDKPVPDSIKVAPLDGWETIP